MADPPDGRLNPTFSHLWQPSWSWPGRQKPKSPIPGVTSIVLPIQASIRSSAPSHPGPCQFQPQFGRVPPLPLAGPGSAMADKELGFHPTLPLVFHPCHLFSRPRTRRTQRPGARVEGGVVICRPGRHWVETEQCCMYTLPWQRPFVGNPPASQDHPCNPPSWHYPSTSLARTRETPTSN